MERFEHECYLCLQAGWDQFTEGNPWCERGHYLCTFHVQTVGTLQCEVCEDESYVNTNTLFPDATVPSWAKWTQCILPAKQRYQNICDACNGLNLEQQSEGYVWCDNGHCVCATHANELVRCVFCPKDVLDSEFTCAACNCHVEQREFESPSEDPTTYRMLSTYWHMCNDCVDLMM
jgi:hypothetical protein